MGYKQPEWLHAAKCRCGKPAKITARSEHFCWACWDMAIATPELVRGMIKSWL